MDFADRQIWQGWVDGADRDGETKQKKNILNSQSWLAGRWHKIVTWVCVAVRHLLYMVLQRALDKHFGIELL